MTEHSGAQDRSGADSGGPEQVHWDGTTRSVTFQDEVVTARHALADAAKAADWRAVFGMLESPHPGQWINATRPDGSARFAPLHQAAYLGAPVEVVSRLLDLGALRTLRNARGERPVDVAVRRGVDGLVELLTPRMRHHVPAGILLKIQDNFHQVIRGRAADLVDSLRLRLPELESLLELRRPEMWFAVPGMYGGFSYRLSSTGVRAKLVSESWCRVVGGSGERHEIDSRGWRLVESGFA